MMVCNITVWYSTVQKVLFLVLTFAAMLVGRSWVICLHEGCIMIAFCVLYFMLCSLMVG